MLTGDAVPLARPETSMETALAEMDRCRLGVIFIRDEQNRLAGIITDGDIRRMVVQKVLVQEQTADAIMTANPKHVHPGTPLYEALNIMEAHQITVLPAIDENGIVVGVLHLHDILGKGALKFNPA
jgi:arabinose-5-phosphate isomerase